MMERTIIAEQSWRHRPRYLARRNPSDEVAGRRTPWEGLGESPPCRVDGGESVVAA